jgi:hypothetical protein
MADISKLNRLVNGVQRAVDLGTNTLVVQNVKVNLGGSNHFTFSGSLTANRTVSIPDSNVNLQHLLDVISLSGVAGGSTNLGTFTGNIIPDNQTIKQALQSLETAIENLDVDSDFQDNLFRISDDVDNTKKIAFEASAIATGTTRTISMANANINLQHLLDLISLSGVSGGSTDLGTFSGNTIPDGQTIKQALQSLENAIESLPDPMEYKGLWNAATNTPTLVNGTGNNGDVYHVSVAGTVDFGAGNISFEVGDKVVYNGASSQWEKWDMTDAVASVNGQTGVVILTTTDISEGTNLYFTDERAQDAVGNALVDSDTIDFIYNDGANTISADVLQSPLVAKLQVAGEAYAANTSFVVRFALSGETAGRVYKADNDASANDKFYAIGLALSTSAVSAGQNIKVISLGTHTLGSSDTPFAAADIGKPVFLGANGAFTVTPPSGANIAVVRVGIVEATNKIWVQPAVVGIDA